MTNSGSPSNGARGGADGFHDAKRSVVLVQGGPGIRKSIIALHLVGELAKRGYNAMHATGSKAFTENMRRVVGPAPDTRSSGTSTNRQRRREGDRRPHPRRGASATRDERQPLHPEDQAHRLPAGRRAHQAAKTTVLFIDDHETVRPN